MTNESNALLENQVLAAKIEVHKAYILLWQSRLLSYDFETDVVFHLHGARLTSDELRKRCIDTISTQIVRMNDIVEKMQRNVIDINMPKEAADAARALGA